MVRTAQVPGSPPPTTLDMNTPAKGLSKRPSIRRFFSKRVSSTQSLPTTSTSTAGKRSSSFSYKRLSFLSHVSPPPTADTPDLNTTTSNDSAAARPSSKRFSFLSFQSPLEPLADDILPTEPGAAPAVGARPTDASPRPNLGRSKSLGRSLSVLSQRPYNSLQRWKSQRAVRQSFLAEWAIAEAAANPARSSTYSFDIPIDAWV